MDNLFKKQRSANGLVYIDIFENVEGCATSISHGRKKPLVKSNRLARRHRNEGYKKLSENQWCDAIEEFNASIRFAEIGSNTVTLAYIGRSTCFFHLKMFDKCLEDIKLAKQAECTKNMNSKMDKLESGCTTAILRGERDEQFVEPKLDFKPNIQFPSMANASVLEIKKNDEFGRGIFAKCQIPMGKTILVEQAFISHKASGPLTSCAACGNFLMNFIACNNCTEVLFCNEMCKVHKSLHKYDCNFVEVLNSELKMIAQSIYFAMETFENVNDLLRFVENAVKNNALWIPNSVIDAQSKYRLFLSLSTNRAKKEGELMSKAKNLFETLWSRPVIKAFFANQRRFLMHLLVKHCDIAYRNLFTCGQFQLQRIQRIAMVPLIFALFNHSCINNAFYTSFGGKHIVKTTRPIKRNEQVFIPYMDPTAPAPIRQIMIESNFGFACNCVKCKEDNETCNIAPAYAFEMIREMQAMFAAVNVS